MGIENRINIYIQYQTTMESLENREAIQSTE